MLDACRSHLALATPAPWIFLEANPEDVTPDACAAWRGLGVRTLSLGVQSFSDEALRFLGRRHSAAQARAAVETAQAAGFDTVSVDLIFGLPGQTPEAWRRELATAVALGPGHLSCYQLTIHPRTRVRRRAPRGASSPRCPRESRPSSSSSRTASSPTRATPRTRSPTSRAAATTSRATTASTGTTRPTSGSAPRRTRSPSTDASALPAARRWWNELRHAAVGEPRGRRRAARRGRGVPRPEGAGDRGGDAGPAHHGRDRPRRLRGALRARPAGRERRPRRPPRGRGPPRRARRPGGGRWLVPTVSGLAVADGMAAAFDIPVP